MDAVLYGAGGELDREAVDSKKLEEVAVSEAVQRLAKRCVLSPGDRIVIEGDED